MKYIFLTASSGSNEPSLPVMVIIAMLCLMLPYLIRRKTGKSVTEWLSLEPLRNWIWSKFPGKKGEKAAKKEETKKAGRAVVPSKVYSDRKTNQKNGKNSSDSQNGVSEKAAQKAASNGMMQFISNVLNFTRRKKLFVIIPGDVQFQDETAELTMLIITKARAVGVICFTSYGLVHCRKDRSPWQETRGEKTVPIGPLNVKAEQQTKLLQKAMASQGMGNIPYETALVFTTPGVAFDGDKPDNVYAAEDFLQSLETERDLTEGSLVPRDVGALYNKMRPKKKKK